MDWRRRNHVQLPTSVTNVTTTIVDRRYTIDDSLVTMVIVTIKEYDVTQQQYAEDPITRGGMSVPPRVYADVRRRPPRAH